MTASGCPAGNTFRSHPKTYSHFFPMRTTWSGSHQHFFIFEFFPFQIAHSLQVPHSITPYACTTYPFSGAR